MNKNYLSDIVEKGLDMIEDNDKGSVIMNDLALVSFYERGYSAREFINYVALKSVVKPEIPIVAFIRLDNCATLNIVVEDGKMEINIDIEDYCDETIVIDIKHPETIYFKLKEESLENIEDIIVGAITVVAINECGLDKDRFLAYMEERGWVDYIYDESEDNDEEEVSEEFCTGHCSSCPFANACCENVKKEDEEEDDDYYEEEDYDYDYDEFEDDYEEEEDECQCGNGDNCCKKNGNGSCNGDCGSHKPCKDEGSNGSFNSINDMYNNALNNLVNKKDDEE